MIKSKYNQYEDQIRSLLEQGHEIKTISHMLAEQGLDSDYNALYAWCRRRGLAYRTRRKKPQQDRTLAGMEVAARKAGMTYGQYVAREYSRLHPAEGGSHERICKNQAPAL